MGDEDSQGSAVEGAATALSEVSTGPSAFSTTTGHLQNAMNSTKPSNIINVHFSCQSVLQRKEPLSCLLVPEAAISTKKCCVLRSHLGAWREVCWLKLSWNSPDPPNMATTSADEDSEDEEDEDRGSCPCDLLVSDSEYIGDEDSCPDLEPCSDDEDIEEFQSKERLSSSAGAQRTTAVGATKCCVLRSHLNAWRKACCWKLSWNCRVLRRHLGAWRKARWFKLSWNCRVLRSHLGAWRKVCWFKLSWNSPGPPSMATTSADEDSEDEEDEDRRGGSCPCDLPVSDSEYIGDEERLSSSAGAPRLICLCRICCLRSLRLKADSVEEDLFFIVFMVTLFLSFLSIVFHCCFIAIGRFSDDSCSCDTANAIRQSYHPFVASSNSVRVGLNCQGTPNLNGPNRHRQITIRRSSQPPIVSVISGSDSHDEYTEYQEPGEEILWRSRKGNHNADEIFQFYVAVRGGADSDSDSDGDDDAGGCNIIRAAEIVADVRSIDQDDSDNPDHPDQHDPLTIDGLEEAEERSETASFSPDAPVDTDGQNRLIDAAEMELYCQAFFKRSDIKSLLLRKNSKQKRILKYFGYTKLFITFCFWKKGAAANNSSDSVSLQLTEYMKVLLSDGREDDGFTSLKKENLSHIKLIATAKNIEDYLSTHFTKFYKK
jgi:hypothetical protein